ncbi:cytochrome P450 [Salix suchowensis]|nr:cytochrome P450 [Salix suchowensis]
MAMRRASSISQVLLQLHRPFPALSTFAIQILLFMLLKYWKKCKTSKFLPGTPQILLIGNLHQLSVHGTKIQFSPFQDMFAAGSDTTVTTIEWATSELLNDPGELDKAQTEVTENQRAYDNKEKQNNYNVWAISRDPQQGIDANSFQP